MFHIKKSILFLMLFMTIAHALPVDRNATLHITADSTIYNFRTEEKEFKGHVQLNQGSTHIKADRLTTKNDDQHQLKEAIAYGILQPAHYWTTPNQKENPIHAYATIIKFYPLAENIILQEKVRLTQNKNSFTGHLIFYNMKTEIVTVPESQKGQSVMIYHPNKHL